MFSLSAVFIGAGCVNPSKTANIKVIVAELGGTVATCSTRFLHSHSDPAIIA
jgi:hypothetical protein